MDENTNIGHKYYFALMLRDSANHLPTIIDNLLRVIYHLGEQNIFISIYEGGSNDDGHTTAMIETIKTTMEAIGIEFNIEVEGASTGNARDKVLKPLKEMYRANERVFNTVVMMGDDLWCAEELLELLFHSRGQAASITCSTDVRADVPLLS
jgi:alpha-1,3-mannosyltransferase